jgi:hypothetical protein
MKNIRPAIFFILIVLINREVAYPQNGAGSCKVLLLNLSATYKGGCKNGLANGEGEAWGLQHYKGNFKNGMPNGFGVYYYDDSTYHSGYFQDGLKEGKGEMHYAHKGKPDSTIKGYWSGNEFRGAKYITYNFDGATKFDRYEIIPSPGSGHSISFEISTTSGSPSGVPSDFQGKPGYVLRLDDLNVGNNIIIRLLSTVETATKFHITYDISAFPAILYATLSNGDSFKLELYKSANWTVRLYINK